MAAPARIRNFSLFYGGRMVATASGHEYTIDMGSEDQIGDGEWLGVSDGVPTTKLTSTEIVPVAGIGVSILQDMLARKYVDVGLGIVDGKIHKITMRARQGRYTTETAHGTLHGEFEFTGGTPKLQ